VKIAVVNVGIAIAANVTMLAALVVAPIASAESGDQADAEQAVTAIYNQVQRRCTPSMSPHLQSIRWDSFYPASYGTGVIHDANSALGGPFTVAYSNPRVGPALNGPAGRPYGQWSVNLEFC
jgi:hypothetical protein